MEKTENERKFLLQKNPMMELMDRYPQYTIYGLMQGYTDDGTRYRMLERNGSAYEFEKVKKEDTDRQDARIEIGKMISQEEFTEGFKQCNTYVKKVRFEIEIEDNVVLVIDEFHEDIAKLVICEVEMMSDGQDQAVTKKLNDFELPPCVKDVLLLEVTHLKEFKNQNLAVPIPIDFS